MKKLFLLLIPLTCLAQTRNVQVNGSGNIITPSTGFNLTSGQTLLASSGATLNFSAATVSLPSTAAIPPPSSPTTGDLLVYSSGAWAKLPPGTSGFALISNGAAAIPTYQAVSGSGTVTSVAATVPSFLSVAGSPVTSSGTLAVTLATQSANLVFAGPASGSAAAPTFRSLVAADLPATAVTPGSYGDATHVGAFTVDAAGRLTAASSVVISGGGGGIGGSTGSTDNAILRADGTGGSTVQSSTVIVDDSGNISTGGTLPGSTAVYVERSGIAVTEIKSTGNDARFRLRRADNSKGSMMEFIRGSTDEFYMGTPFTGGTPDGTGNQFVINYYLSGDVTVLALSTTGALQLPQYTTPGSLRVDSSGNVTANSGYVTSAVAGGSAVSLTTATAANVTSISVPAGTWFISGNINFSASSATVTGTSGGISSTSATIPTDGTEVYSGVQVTLLSEVDSVTLPPKQFVLGSTTTVYLVGKSTFSAGSVGAFGQITAVRAY